MSNDKLWCGSAKPIDHPKFEPGSFDCILCLDDIPQHATFEMGGKTMVKLDMLKRREPSDKGATHGFAVNTYKPPEPTQDNTPPPPPQAPPPPSGAGSHVVQDDDEETAIPF